MANVNFFSPDGGTTRYPLEDTEGRITYEEEIHGVNLFDDSKIEVGKAWNGDTNANRARNIIPCEPNSEYIISMNGTNGLDGVFFSVSASIPPASQTIITSFPYTIRTGTSDRYITLGFNKTNIALSDVTALKIMLHKADIEDSTYRPYNPQAIQNQLNAQGVLGAKNLLPISLSTRTENGVTVTVNKDSNGNVLSVVLNGTSTSSGQFNLNDTSGLLNSLLQKYGDLIWSGCPSRTDCRMYTHISGGSYVTLTNNEEKILSASNNYDANILVQYDNGVTYNNVTFYPMLRLASDPDDTYQPYAMTNRELTEVKDVTVTAGTNVTLNTSTNVSKVGKIISGCLRLEFTGTLTVQQVLATLSDKPIKNIYTIGIESATNKVMPIIILSNGQVMLFGSNLPTDTNNHLIIPVNFIAA